MNRCLPLFLLALLLLGLVPARAQFGSFGDVPIEIDAEQTRFEGGVAVAEGNVLIRYGDLAVYADYAQYNPDTRDVLVLGNVRIYQGVNIFAGERAIYNLETKQLTGADIKTEKYPANISAGIVSSLGPNAYLGRDVTATTHDSSKPDYHIHARSMRLYLNDRVIFRDVTIYLGRTPILWLPVVYQNLNQEQGFSAIPGYHSSLGAYLFTNYTFPLGNALGVTVRLDFMTERGVAAGLDMKWQGEKSTENWGRFRSYILEDQKTAENPTALPRDQVDSLRYRVSFQDRTYLTEDIYSTIDINKLSDINFLQDFEPGLFSRDPNPDNVVALTYWNENFNVTALGRLRLNDFLDFTERLPEADLDIKRQPIFGHSGLFYEGETSAGYLKRRFAEGSMFQDFEAFRADSFHQIVFPQTLFGWLSVIPRAGFRGTYYSETGELQTPIVRTDYTDPAGNPVFIEVPSQVLVPGGSVFRTVFNAGVETSFKLSKAYEEVQSRRFGLDGLRHILQPYANYSFVSTSEAPSGILQFDRINPATRQPPIDFPQFNAIDSIDNWNILRLGTHNRFQTRRDNDTFNWLQIDTFVDIRFQRPEFERTFLSVLPQPLNNVPFDFNSILFSRVADPGTFSNLYNSIHFNPVPWFDLRVDTQFPVFDDGFKEIFTRLNFLPTSFLQVSLSHRYLEGNKLFADTNDINLNTYVRFTENWGLAIREGYQFESGLLVNQSYEIYRDLSSWVASLAFLIQDNGAGQKNYGLSLTFTLKDLPLARIPFKADPNQIASGFGGKNQN